MLVALLIALALLSPRYWEVIGAKPFHLTWLTILALLTTLPFALEGTEDLLVVTAMLPIFLAPAVTMLLHEEPHFGLL